MKKINQIATISDVTLNDKLKEWNEDNSAFRVQLRIAYAAENSKDEDDDDLLSLADFEEAGASVGKTYTCLINFDSLLTDKHTEKEQDKALAKLVEKFKGKKARFSTFDFTISELTAVLLKDARYDVACRHVYTQRNRLIILNYEESNFDGVS